ncbi:hypothetical protein OTB20_12265 [Streptomyces sp. H27-H1]|uniref:hypothetical protein n=1 Tax=unclassified Streptomyces TaxID=2593676 RepID=UPI0022704DC7|nr:MULTISPECIES: hypothetical protein [unclassified Streptomyces]MCY0926963.1 hypothetical protein [Streptomyces sp. H27-H1]MCY0933227.1 hypothetical protein [Streptomyces sp. H34-S4]
MLLPSPFSGRGLCFGDPSGQAVAIQDREEGIGDTLAAKIRASLTYYRHLLPEAAYGVQLHGTTLYTSLIRYDELPVNRQSGGPARAKPFLHLKRGDGTEWFDNYAESFQTVWAAARSWIPDQKGTAAHGQD